MKKIMLILALVLGMSLVPANAETIQNVKVKIDGQMVNFPDEKPYIEDGRTLVPVRFIIETLKANVIWKDADKTVDITTKDKSIKLKVDDDKAVVNNEVQILDVKAKNQNGRVFVPLRFITENIGLKVDWEDSTKTVILTSFQEVQLPATPESVISDDIFSQEGIEKLVWKLFDIDENGKIYFTHVSGHEGDKYYLKEELNPDIARQVKEVIKSLIDKDNYVYMFAGENGVNIRYGKGWKGAERGYTLFDYNFLATEPYNGRYDSNYSKFSEASVIGLKLNALTWNKEGYEFYTNKLKISLQAIFGDSTGSKIYEYVLDEYTKETKVEKEGNWQYKNYKVKVIDNIQIDFAVDYYQTYFDFTFLD